MTQEIVIIRATSTNASIEVIFRGDEVVIAIGVKRLVAHPLAILLVGKSLGAKLP